MGMLVVPDLSSTDEASSGRNEVANGYAYCHREEYPERQEVGRGTMSFFERCRRADATFGDENRRHD